MTLLQIFEKDLKTDNSLQVNQKNVNDKLDFNYENIFNSKLLFFLNLIMNTLKQHILFLRKINLLIWTQYF